MKKQIEDFWKKYLGMEPKVVTDGECYTIDGVFCLDPMGDLWGASTWLDSGNPEDSGETTLASNKTFDEALKSIVLYVKEYGSNDHKTERRGIQSLSRLI